MFDLVVVIDYQATNAVTYHGGSCFFEDRIDCRRLIIKPNQPEVIGHPFCRIPQLAFTHPLPRAFPKRQAEMLLSEFGNVLGRRVFEGAYRKPPLVFVSEIYGYLIDELGLAAAWNAGDDRQF